MVTFDELRSKFWSAAEVMRPNNDETATITAAATNRSSLLEPIEVYYKENTFFSSDDLTDVQYVSAQLKINNQTTGRTSDISI